jgi:hypothetical protein
MRRKGEVLRVPFQKRLTAILAFVLLDIFGQKGSDFLEDLKVVFGLGLKAIFLKGYGM